MAAENDLPAAMSVCTATSADASFLLSVCSEMTASARMSGRPALIRPDSCFAKIARSSTLTPFSNPGIEISWCRPVVDIGATCNGASPCARSFETTALSLAASTVPLTTGPPVVPTAR